METPCKITFQPQGRSVYVLRGTTILEAAARAGLVLDTPCGGAGTCGKCRVQLVTPRPPPTSADRARFTPEEWESGWRLACRTRVESDAVVSVPESSLFGRAHQIVATAEAGGRTEVRPAIRKQYVELAPPTLEDDAPDLLRLERAVGPFKADLPLIRQVSAELRAHQFSGTAVLADHRLIDFERGDTRARCYGVAFDIGTTTMVGELVSLLDGRSAGVVSRLNPQVSFGDDVLSRIKHATSCPECLDEMRLALIREIGGMIDALCAAAKIDREHIYEAAFAGNTTMEHILCGINPAQLGEWPFVPAHARGLMVPAGDWALPIHHRALAYVFPIIGGFVGGDTVAGMLATRLDEMEGPVLMVDIGTNGEIVLAHEGRFYAASAAAGPAFEGARIACGMRGTQGAIEKVLIDGDLRLEVIGNVPPVGLCGSGLIDLVAELLDQGVISPEGHFRTGADLPSTLPPGLANRLRPGAEGDLQFDLVDAVGGGARTPVFLTQRDIRELQLGSGAIRAGILLLTRLAGLTVSDLKTVLIAGGFGNFIRRRSAQRIGLLPAGIDARQIRHVGNVSLAGARAALLSVDARRQGEALARSVHHVDLSSLEGFHEVFTEAMMFPDGVDEGGAG